MYDSLAFQRAGLRGEQLKKAVMDTQMAKVRGGKHGMMMAGEMLAVQVAAPAAIMKGLRYAVKGLHAYQKSQIKQLKNIKSASKFFQTKAGGASPGLVDDMAKAYVSANRKRKIAKAIYTPLNYTGYFLKSTKAHYAHRYSKHSNYKSNWLSFQGTKYKTLSAVQNSKIFTGLKRIANKSKPEGSIDIFPLGPSMQKLNTAINNKRGDLANVISLAREGHFPKKVVQNAKLYEGITKSDASIGFVGRVGAALGSDHTPRRFTDSLTLEHQKEFGPSKFAQIIRGQR